MKDLQFLIDREISRAETKGDYNSYHEAYAVLLEEVDEFWDEVKKKPNKRDATEILKELIQIAAVAQKTIRSFKLVEAAQYLDLIDWDTGRIKKKD